MYCAVLRSMPPAIQPTLDGEGAIRERGGGLASLASLVRLTGQQLGPVVPYLQFPQRWGRMAGIKHPRAEAWQCLIKVERAAIGQVQVVNTERIGRVMRCRAVCVKRLCVLYVWHTSRSSFRNQMMEESCD